KIEVRRCKHSCEKPIPTNFFPCCFSSCLLSNSHHFEFAPGPAFLEALARRFWEPAMKLSCHGWRTALSHFKQRLVSAWKRFLGLKVKNPKKVPSMRTQLSSSVRHFFCGGPVICTARTPNVAGNTCFPCHRSFSLPSAPRTFFLPRPPH